jgi:MFS family permease
MLRAFRSRNYRLYFFGQSVSLMGSWMTRLATSWLVYRLTENAFLLGVVGFAGQIPAFVLSPFAGVFLDRWNKHRLLVFTQALAMLQSFAMAWLALNHKPGSDIIPFIIALSIFQGLINSFDMPARQSFVVQMVDKREDLSNAIALNSSMVNLARLIGPTIGGFIIAFSGQEGWCFLIDGVSYLAVIGSLYLMRVPMQPAREGKKTSNLAQLREGWAYVSGFAPIRKILLLLSLTSLVGVPYTVFMPIFAKEILHGGPAAQGWLMGASGAGALTGAIFLASRRTVLGLSKLIPFMAALFGVGLIAFSRSTNLWLSLLLLPFIGFGFMVQMASSNTLVQTIVDDDKRGRVMSFYMMSFVGTVPFGSLLGGVLAKYIGAPNTVLLGGIGCIAGAMWFGRSLPEWHEAVRPIYERMGILPEVAAGMQSAAELTRPPED